MDKIAEIQKNVFPILAVMSFRSVCSTTLWVGQLDKRTQQQDVACLLEEFGQIDSINVSELKRSIVHSPLDKLCCVYYTPCFHRTSQLLFGFALSLTVSFRGSV